MKVSPSSLYTAAISGNGCWSGPVSFFQSRLRGLVGFVELHLAPNLEIQALRRLDLGVNVATLDFDQDMNFMPGPCFCRPPALETAQIRISGPRLFGRLGTHAKENQQDRQQDSHVLTLSPCREAFPFTVRQSLCRLPNPAFGEEKVNRNLAGEPARYRIMQNARSSPRDIGHGASVRSRLDLRARSFPSSQVFGRHPGLNFQLKLLSGLRLPCRQVAPFGGVGGNVIKFGLASPGITSSKSPLQGGKLIGSLALPLPEHGSFRHPSLAGQDGQYIDAVNAPGRVNRSACGRDQSGKQVVQVNDLSTNLSRGDLARPAGQTRNSNATLPNSPFLTREAVDCCPAPNWPLDFRTQRLRRCRW